MKIGPSLGLVLGAGCAIAIGCAASNRGVSQSPQTMPSVNGAASSTETEHQQIARLDKAIDDELAQRGIQAAATPGCGPDDCRAAVADPMGVPAPRTADPTCRPGSSEACQSSCTLADSICRNAGKICELAQQLGGGDVWANQKCVKGRGTCSTAHQSCCSCQL